MSVKILEVKKESFPAARFIGKKYTQGPNWGVPLWKSQMVIALGIEHSRQAMEAGRMVTDMTNELLKKNSDALRQATVDITRESERSVVDIETLTHTNEQLIQTLDEIKQIQKEGRDKRVAAEAELGRIESDLKAKLIGMANS